MKVLKIAVTLILFSILIYFGFRAYQYAKSYENATALIAKESDAISLAKEKLDRLTSVISFGLIENHTKVRLNRLKEQKRSYQELSMQFLYYYMGVLTTLIIISLNFTQINSLLIFAISSLISLIFGLINPILMVTIHKNIEHLGDVILSFESKGLLGSILKLFENSEYAIAFAILLFSVIIPFLKISTLIFALLFRDYRFTHHLINSFKHLGKWSMLDVFVVAILLVYLTSNSGDVSHAEIQIGLYLFLTYVILSMITTIKFQKISDQ